MGGSGARSGAVLLQSGVCSAGARHWVVLVRSAGRHRAVLVRGTGWCCAAPGSSGAAQRLRPRPLRSPPLPAGGRASPPPRGRLLLVASPANQRRRAGDSKRGGACARRHEWRGAARGGGAAVCSAAGRARGVRGHRDGLRRGAGGERGRALHGGGSGVAAARALQRRRRLCSRGCCIAARPWRCCGAG